MGKEISVKRVENLRVQPAEGRFYDLKNPTTGEISSETPKPREAARRRSFSGIVCLR